jgi:hypothetical protein
VITFPVGASLLQLGELLTTLAMARAGNSHSDTAVAITSLVATPTDPHHQTNEFEVLRTAAPRKLNLITARQNEMGMQSVTVKPVWKLTC